MIYRPFGKLDWKTSALGFGCMRLPTLDGKPQSPNIDRDQTIRMIRLAVDRGVNYVDTAYPYHGGQSEVVTGLALRDGYRDRVKLATKAPVWQIEKPSDFDRYLNEQLGRLGTDRVDFYLLHALGTARWRNIVLKHGLLERAEAAVKDGRVGHIGFSFHDSFDAFREVLEGYDGWEMCQIQYNYMDTENQAGTRGLELAASKGLAVVVMEPLLGGRLAAPPEAVADILRAAGSGRRPAEWALDWVWNDPRVANLLSGMSSLRQVEENLASAERSRTGALTEAELEAVGRARTAFAERTPIPCTRCGYCLPCPNGVDIPTNFRLLNECVVYDDPAIPRATYARFVPEAERASACTGCRECEAKCPQDILISECMPEVDAVLGGRKSHKGFKAPVSS
jgi:predicted aldo/keto reductase-like oxidoreductase